MSSRSRRSSSSARRGRRSATSTATSTSNEGQPVSDELAALISSTVREEIRRLSTAPPPTSSPADHSASASSADLQSASQVPPPPGCDDLLGPPMGLDLEAGPSTSPSTSQSAALPSVPTKLCQRILRGEFVNLDELLPENLSKQPKEQICWQASSADTHAPLTISLPDTTARRKVVDMSSWVQAFTNYAATVLRWAPERAAELMGYQALISQAFQNFQNSAVLAYDREFRALISQSAGRRLDEVDTTLWAMKFTGQARSSCPRCMIHHSRDHCFQRLFRGRGASPGAFPSASSFGSHVQPQPQRPSPRAVTITRTVASPTNATTEPCRNFNRGRCNFASCPRPHVCLTCGSQHPALHCRAAGAGSSST